MNKYDIETPCSKCGCGDADTNYYSVNKLKRTCVNCGYEWYEEPLDSE